MEVDCLFKREIEFRCWDKADSLHRDKGVMSYGITDVSCDADAIMQYTGLKDRNDKKIYEGDIIKCHDQWSKDKVYFVEYGLAGFYPFADEDDGVPYPVPEECEIIGNMFENPELYFGD